MANKRSSDHLRATSGLPPATDIQAPKSAFALISSAVPAGADAQDGGADSPKVTQGGHHALQGHSDSANVWKWMLARLIG